MFRQILSRLPRKSLASDSPETPRSGGVKSSAVFPSGVVTDIEPHMLFKDVAGSERMDLFMSKLNVCSVVYDFTDVTNNTAEKDLKRQALVDVVDFITSNEGTDFPEAAIAAACRTAAANLFRVFPPNCNRWSENEEDDPVFDPSWTHLHLVYELILKLVTSSNLEPRVAKRYIDHAFILRLLDLFDSEDPRERECLKTLVHRIYGKFMVHRPFIRRAINNVFYRFALGGERHSGVAELLEIFGSVISGFALPLKEEHRVFFRKTLVLLHKPKSAGSYFQQLSYCVTQFIEKESSLASTAVEALLKYWPLTSSRKEVMFIGELEEIVESMGMEEFQKIMFPLFFRFSRCINSYHFQVAERALFLWNNDRIMSLVARNKKAILPIVYPALESNMRNHWNHAVVSLSGNVRKLLAEIDDDALLVTFRLQFNDHQARVTSAAEKRRAMWERLEESAAGAKRNINPPLLLTTTSSA